MAAAVIGSLRIVLGLDSAQFNEGMTAARKHLRDVGRQMQSVGNTMALAGAGMTAAITAPLIAAGFAASKAANEAADAMGQVEAALKSMGDASGQTKESLAGLASDVMRNSLYDDDDILRKVTANLLTFGKVAGDEFGRAQRVIADVATRMKMDLQPATLLIGKALNDPIKGMTAMGRAGIQFTEAQKKTIETMVETGNVAGAQGIILTELERQFGGAAAAAQDTDPYDGLRDSLNDLSESFGALINVHLKPFINTLKGLVDTFNGLSPQMQNFALIGGVIAAALGPALIVIGSIVSAIGSLVVAFASGGILAGLGAFVVAAAPFVAAGIAIAGVIYLFRDEFAPIMKEFMAAATEALGPTLTTMMAAAKEAFAALGPAISAVVGVVGPLLAGLSRLFLQAFGPIILTALRVLVTGVSNAFAIIGQALRVITALLTGDWQGAWNAAGTLVGTIAQGIGRVIDAVFPGALNVITRMVDGVKKLFRVDLAKAFDDAKAKVREVGDAFYNLWDRVVGHSYIPDLVEDIGTWMSKLQEVLVDPATTATKDAGDRFQALRERVRGIIQGLLTDKEKLDLSFAGETAALNDPNATRGIAPSVLAEMRRRSAARNAADNAGLDARGLAMPTGDAITEVDQIDGVKALNDTWAEMQQRIRDSRENFADSFGYGIEQALAGDWQGLLRTIVGDVFGDSLRNLGRSIFDMFNKGGGGGFSLGGIGKAFSSILGGLPKFANEGTIKAGGAGGIDSQLVSFWKSPDEQVDIYRPDNDGGPAGGGVTHNHFSGNLMTPEFWARIQNGDRGAAQYGRTNGAMDGAKIVAGSAERQQRQTRMYKK